MFVQICTRTRQKTKPLLSSDSPHSSGETHCPAGIRSNEKWPVEYIFLFSVYSYPSHYIPLYMQCMYPNFLGWYRYVLHNLWVMVGTKRCISVYRGTQTYHSHHQTVITTYRVYMEDLIILNVKLMTLDILVTCEQTCLISLCVNFIYFIVIKYLHFFLLKSTKKGAKLYCNLYMWILLSKRWIWNNM